jgi:hypothetical protein
MEFNLKHFPLIETECEKGAPMEVYATYSRSTVTLIYGKIKVLLSRLSLAVKLLYYL